MARNDCESGAQGEGCWGKVTRWPFYSTGAGSFTMVKGNKFARSSPRVGVKTADTHISKRGRVTVGVVGVGFGSCA